MAKTLRAALMVLMTVAIFDSLAYNANIPIVAGMTTALMFIARAQRATIQEQRRVSPEAPELPALDPEPVWSAALY